MHLVGIPKGDVNSSDKRRAHRLKRVNGYALGISCESLRISLCFWPISTPKREQLTSY